MISHDRDHDHAPRSTLLLELYRWFNLDQIYKTNRAEATVSFMDSEKNTGLMSK